MAMTAVLSANNYEEVFVLPYLPPEWSWSEGQTIDTYDGLSRSITMPGNMEPQTFSWSALYPRQRYSFTAAKADTNPEAFVEFIRKWREKHYPLRLTITDGDKTLVYIPVLVDSFSHSYLKNRDLKYSISLVEYKFL